MINFERNGKAKESMGIGKWENAIPVNFIQIIGTIGWGANTEEVSYKFEGIDLKNFLKAIEDSGRYTRGKASDEIAQNYMRAVYYGTCIIHHGKCPVEEHILRACIWDIKVNVHVDAFDIDPSIKSWQKSIEEFAGRVLSYEGNAYMIPEEPF